jgi:hypothetical protein
LDPEPGISGYRHRMPEKQELRRTFVPKREKVTGGWRKSYNGDIHVV